MFNKECEYQLLLWWKFRLFASSIWKDTCKIRMIIWSTLTPVLMKMLGPAFDIYTDIKTRMAVRFSY